jgi:hypothetical protein
MVWRPEIAWNYILKTYNMTKECYLEMYNEQNGCCAICGLRETEIQSNGHEKFVRTKALCVDHDHGTGVIRGLLCARCNRVLGKIKDNIELLESMISYLKEYEDLKYAH